MFSLIFGRFSLIFFLLIFGCPYWFLDFQSFQSIGWVETPHRQLSAKEGQILKRKEQTKTKPQKPKSDSEWEDAIKSLRDCDCE